MKVTIDIPKDRQADVLALLGLTAATSTTSTTSTPPAEKPEPPADETPAQKKKRLIAEEIESLGGTPPEKGSLAKFEAALAELKDTDNDDDTGEECEINGATVRKLAKRVLDQDDAELGETQLAAALKKVGCTSVSAATDAELKQLVPLLEKNAGCTLAEANTEQLAQESLL